MRGIFGGKLVNRVLYPFVADTRRDAQDSFHWSHSSWIRINMEKSCRHLVSSVLRVLQQPTTFALSVF